MRISAVLCLTCACVLALASAASCPKPLNYLAPQPVVHTLSTGEKMIFELNACNQSTFYLESNPDDIYTWDNPTYEQTEGGVILYYKSADKLCYNLMTHHVSLSVTIQHDDQYDIQGKVFVDSGLDEWCYRTRDITYNMTWKTALHF